MERLNSLFNYSVKMSQKVIVPAHKTEEITVDATHGPKSNGDNGMISNI